MPYANNQGIRIHYEVEGSGPPLVLQHGFSLDRRSWLEPENWVEALKTDYHIILMDARGHGDSDKPHDAEAYRLVHMASDVIAILDHHGLPNAHFLGYSMGGKIGLGLARYFPDRFISLLIGGASPEETSLEGEPDPRIEILKQGIEPFKDWLRQVFKVEIPAEWEAQWRNADPLALAALLSVKEHHGFAEAFLKLTTPCLFYMGDKDGGHDYTREFCRRMPGATFVSLPGGHADLSLQLVLPHIRKFLAKVSQIQA